MGEASSELDLFVASRSVLHLLGEGGVEVHLSAVATHSAAVLSLRNRSGPKDLLTEWIRAKTIEVVPAFGPRLVADAHRFPDEPLMQAQVLRDEVSGLLRAGALTLGSRRGERGLQASIEALWERWLRIAKAEAEANAGLQLPEDFGAPHSFKPLDPGQQATAACGVKGRLMTPADFQGRALRGTAAFASGP